MHRFTWVHIKNPFLFERRVCISVWMCLKHWKWGLPAWDFKHSAQQLLGSSRWAREWRGGRSRRREFCKTQPAQPLGRERRGYSSGLSFNLMYSHTWLWCCKHISRFWVWSTSWLRWITRVIMSCFNSLETDMSIKIVSIKNKYDFNIFQVQSNVLHFFFASVSLRHRIAALW